MFSKELSELINRNSMESVSDTPDYILANYMQDCLDAFNKATISRTLWYKNKPTVPQLGVTTTRELLGEIKARIEMDGDLDYKPTDSD